MDFLRQLLGQQVQQHPEQVPEQAFTQQPPQPPQNIVTFPPSSSSSSSSSLFCTRCLRATHTRNQCHAQRDVRGNEIVDTVELDVRKIQREKDLLLNSSSSKKRVAAAEDGEILEGEEGAGGATGQKKPKKRQQVRKAKGGEKEKERDRRKNAPPSSLEISGGRKQREFIPVCTKWGQGKCVLGSSCYYSHDGPGWDPRSNQLCAFFRAGTCKKTAEECFYSHNFKDFACVFFHLHRNGGCGKTEEECPFSHGELSSLQREELERDEQKYQATKEKKLAGITGAPVSQKSDQSRGFGLNRTVSDQEYFEDYKKLLENDN